MMPVHDQVVVTGRTAGADLTRCVAVAIDVGKTAALAVVEDFTGGRLGRPIPFAMTRQGIVGMVAAVQRLLPPDVLLVRVGVEACGHYHHPVVAPGVWPEGWEVVELNPAWVTAQRRVNGTARRKTDAIDAAAIADLLRAGRGHPVHSADPALVELQAWVAHRYRRVQARTAVKNQLVGQLDRCFPGLATALPDVLGTKVGRLVAAEFTDPARLAALGTGRFRRFAAARDVQVQIKVAERLLAAARDAVAAGGTEVARRVAAADVALLDRLDGQIGDADTQIAGLIPATPYAVLRTGPGWGTVRVGGYAAALGDPNRWPSHRQVYRAAGLTPAQYESAGTRRDGTISREGSVTLRRAVLELGKGLWLHDPAGRRYAAALRSRGKPGGIIGCALGRRANSVAFAMVRDQRPYNPTCWE
jgi:transposase